MAVSFGRLLLIVNGILIFTAFVITLIFAVAFTYPAGLKAFGKFYTSTYMNIGSSRANRAIDALQDGNTRKAFALLSSWEDYREGDRYFALKRNVALALARNLEASGAYQESADVIAPFVEEDDRDLVSFIVWANAAMELEDLKEDAAARITDYWARFPASQNLTELYFRKVYAWDDPAHARRLVDTHGYLNTAVGRGWELFWATDKGFSPNSRKQLEFDLTGSKMTTTIELPKGVLKLRLDAPPGQKLQISDLEIHLQKDPSKAVTENSFAFNMIKSEGNVLKTSGGNDPFIVIDTSELASEAPDPMTLVISMDVENVFSAWLRKRVEAL